MRDSKDSSGRGLSAWSDQVGNQQFLFHIFDSRIRLKIKEAVGLLILTMKVKTLFCVALRLQLHSKQQLLCVKLSTASYLEAGKMGP